MNGLFSKKYDELFCQENGFSAANQDLSVFFYDYEYNFVNCDNDHRLITAGYGMNNTPHIMTALQLVRMINLQKAGYHTQIVLGDYDVLLARGFSESERIAEIYMNFAISLGYDVNKGIIRTQTQATDVAANVVYLSSKVQDDDFEYVKEDLCDYYHRNERHISMDFPTKVSIMLMMSDFISPLLMGQYENVVVASGIDESKYAVLANLLTQRLEIQGSVGGIFTKVVKGLNNHPKMSKSKPDSGIFLSDDYQTIARKINTATNYSKECIQCQLALILNSSYSADKIEEAFQTKDLKTINRINCETIDNVYNLAVIWQKQL